MDARRAAPVADDYVRAVTRVVVLDGDTFGCDVDLGFYVLVRLSCRLAGLNTPDRGEHGYMEARNRLAFLLTTGTVTVRSVRADKYSGRFDAIVQVTGGGRTIIVNDVMINEGYAVPWDGTGPRPSVPWPPVRKAAG